MSRCEVNIWSAALFVHFFPHDSSSALYSVRNNSVNDIVVWQKNSIFAEKHALTIRSGFEDV